LNLEHGDKRPQQTVEVLALTDTSAGRRVERFLTELTTEQIHTENTTTRQTHEQTLVVSRLNTTELFIINLLLVFSS